MTLPFTSSRDRGLSLVELLMFISIVAIGMTAVLKVFVQATSASADPLLQRQALAIAESMLDEVLLMPFTWCDADDAVAGSAGSAAECGSQADQSGPEPGETRTALPVFDHVNDYHGYSSVGVRNLAGDVVPGLAGYQVQVTVAPSGLHTLSEASGNALRVSVTVRDPNGSPLTLVGYRSRHAPNATP